MTCSLTDHGDYGFLGPLALNILSIRSVIMNPPTMLLVAATIAIVPSTVASVLCAASGQDDRADHRDRVERVGQRHQRRVQQGRDPPDHFEADECRQHEHVEAGDQVELHVVAPLGPAGGGSAKNSRTRALTTSPPRVSRVSRMISSFRSSASLPSLTRWSRNAVTFRAYIWLA